MEYGYNQVIIYCFSVEFCFTNWTEIWNNCYNNITVSAFCADQIQVSYKYILFNFQLYYANPQAPTVFRILLEH